MKTIYNTYLLYLFRELKKKKNYVFYIFAYVGIRIVTVLLLLYFLWSGIEIENTALLSFNLSWYSEMI